MYLLKKAGKQYIYKLKAGDSIIIHKDDSQLYVILVGVMSLYKIFNNKEVCPLSILCNRNIILPIFESNYNINYYYRIEALSTTYIISLCQKKFYPFELVLTSKYKDLVSNNYSLTEILIHKNIKYRLAHLLLLLSENFGIIKYNQVIIPLTLPYKTLSIIIGSNRNSVGQIVRTLEKDNIIQHYSNYIAIHNLLKLNNYIYR